MWELICTFAAEIEIITILTNIRQIFDEYKRFVSFFCNSM